MDKFFKTKRLAGPLLSFFLTIGLTFEGTALRAQNLVPNGSFEAYTNLPYSYGQWHYCAGWSSVNNYPAFQWPYASPDYLHDNGSGGVNLPATTFGTVNAATGSAIMGAVYWHPSASNFREYLSTQLSVSLVPCATYQVSMKFTNGIQGAYGGYGTRNIGVHFSTSPLTQNDHEPINVTPHWESSSIVYSTSWQLLTFQFTPSQAYSYITIGNFKDDPNTVRQFFASTSNPSAYYFIDDINITLLSSGGISLAFSTTNETCSPGNDGTSSISVNGGSGPYTYNWSNGATTNSLSGLSAGSYAVIVTDANGCTASGSATIGTGIPSGPPGTWRWTGALSNDWFNPCNWDKIAVPDTTADVLIPGPTPFQPNITIDTGYCQHITIQVDSGAHLRIDNANGGKLIKFP